MVLIEATEATIDGTVKQFCAPLFASDQVLRSEHGPSTTNATITFVEFESRIYGVTCHHVLAAYLSESAHRNLRLIPSIHSGRAIYQFSNIAPHCHRWSFRSCREFPSWKYATDDQAANELGKKNAHRPDIAIADLTSNWPILTKYRGARAIQLDSWQNPDWTVFQPVWMAYGFPNGHKYQADDKVAAPMPRVSAELASAPPVST